MKFNFAIPVTVDTLAMKNVGQTAMKAINSGDRLCAVLKLSNYKMKTVCGNELPGNLRQEVTQHVHMMRQRKWLSVADEAWCKENHIS